MKKISASLVALTAALMVAPAAHAEMAPGWYAAAGLGITFAENPTFHTPAGKSKGRVENTNADVLGAVGYEFGNGLRLEGEFFHNQHNLKRLDNVPGGGHISNNILFVNAYYDLPVDTLLTPYVGAGIGPDFVNVENYGTSSEYLKGDAVVGAYQAIIGVAAKIDENWAVSADYRYIASFDPKVKFNGGATEGRTENASQDAILSVRYKFGGAMAVEPVSEVQVPAVRTAAPAKTEVAPVEESFMVFFDFDKSTLTPEAKNIIAAAAKKFMAGGFARIVVTGHTDTVGTKAYNQKLSERRAQAVEAELGKLGVGAANIKAAGAGENSLLVPTTEGVREAQNRRGEIVLSK